MLKQLFYLFALRGLHLLEDLLRGLLGQISQQISRSIGIHLLDDIGRPFRVERLHDRDLQLGIDLFDSFGGYLLVQALEHGFTFRRRKLFEDVRNIGRMQARQPLVLDLQFDPPRRIGFDQVHELPWNDLGGYLLDQPLDCVLRYHAPEQPPHSTARTNVNLSHLQLEAASVSVFLMKIYIIYADDFPAVHVDDLLVEQVTLKQEEVLRLLHCRPGVQISSAAEERVSSETQGICGNQAISGFRANDERRDPVGI